jgi:hypothetical protein
LQLTQQIFNTSTFEWRTEKVSGEIPYSVPLSSTAIEDHIYSFPDNDKVYVLNTNTFVWQLREMTHRIMSRCHGGRKGFSANPYNNHIIVYGGGCDEKDDRFLEVISINTSTLYIL